MGVGALCHAPPFRLCFLVKKKKINGAAEICQTILMVSVAYGQGWIQAGRMRGMHFPTSHFQKCF